MASVGNRTKALKSTPPQPGAASLHKGFQGFHARFQCTDLLGAEIDKWRLERVIGEGGMSAVYEASHLWLEQRAAVKILLPVFYGDDVILQRFQQEALTLSQIQHPHVIEIKDFGEDPSVGYYMVLALLKGCDLHDIVERYAPLPLSWVVRVMSQLCQGLKVVHDAGILHRDLKPSNVFLSPGAQELHPHARLLDFGIAKVQMSQGKKRITTTGTIVGTPAYLAPEQVLPRKQMTPATDIYAMGVMLYEMLTGMLPFEGDSSIEHLLMVVNEPAPLLGEQRPEFSGSALELLINSTLAREADARPSCAMSLLRALEKAAIALEDPRDVPAHFPVIPTSIPQQATRPETQDRVRFSVQGDRVLAESSDELRVPDGFAGQAYLETLDAPEDEERSPLPTEEPVGAAQGAAGRPAASDAAGTLSIKPSTLWRGLLLLTVLSLLTGGALGVWYWRAATPRHQTTTHAPRPIETRPRGTAPASRLDPIATMLRQADQAMAQGKKDQALRLWREAIARVPNKAQPTSGWLSHPRLWSHTLDVVAAYRRLGHLTSAATLLQRGLATTATTQRRQGRAILAALRAKIAAREPKIARLKQQLSQRLKQRQWLLAELSFQTLRKIAPSSPEVTSWLAQALASTCPELARQLHQELLMQLLATPKQRARAKSQREALAKRIAAQKQAFSQWLQQVSIRLREPKTWSSGIRMLRAQLPRRDAVRRPYGQAVLRQWFKEQLASYPTKASSLWSVFSQVQQRLMRGERWLWFKYVSAGSPVPSKQRLASQGAALRQYQRAHRRLEEARSAMARGRLKLAEMKYQEALTSWASFVAVDLWDLQTSHRQRFAKARRWSEALPSLRRLEQKLNAALRRGDARKARILENELMSLLQGSPARAAMKQRLAAQEAQRKRRLALLQRGHAAYQQKRWAQARAIYRRYRKRYPKAASRAQLKRRLKACRCAMKLFAFEICKPEEFPKHYRQRRKAP